MFLIKSFRSYVIESLISKQKHGKAFQYMRDID